MSSLVQELFRQSNNRQGTQRGSSRRSRIDRNMLTIDIINEESAVIIYAELPGVSSENITIDVLNDTLTIKATKVPSYNQQPFTTEIFYGEISREIRLPFCVTKKETVNVVEYKNGLLKLKIDSFIEEENRFTVDIPDQKE